MTPAAAPFPIRALLLCGGSSSRFGGDKLLAPLDGEPVAARAARNLLAGAGSALAVVPLGSAALAAALEAVGCEVLETDRAARGMGASLAAGVAATDRAGGWIVALGDMPLVAPATIAAVRDALLGGAAAAAPFAPDGRRGHPVGFGAQLRPELLALDGDVGARGILERHRDRVRRIPCADPGMLVDLDTPEQLAALQAPGEIRR